MHSMSDITIGTPSTPKIKLGTAHKEAISIYGAGTKKHSKLDELDFENSGHTGFQAALSAQQLTNIGNVPNCEKSACKATSYSEADLGSTVKYPSMKCMSEYVSGISAAILDEVCPKREVSGYPARITDALGNSAFKSMEIHGVSGGIGTLNDNGLYEFGISIHGKNLMDMRRYYNELYEVETNHTGEQAVTYDKGVLHLSGTYGKYTLQFMNGEFKPSTRYTMSWVGTNISQNAVAGFIVAYTDGTSSLMPIDKTDYKQARTLTTVSGKTVKHIEVNSYSPGTIFEVSEIQIEEGTLATGYESFSEASAHVLSSDAVGENCCIDMLRGKIYALIPSGEWMQTGGATITPEKGDYTKALSVDSVIECTGVANTPSKIEAAYYQDINKLIASLTSAALAQGANV